MEHESQGTTPAGVETEKQISDWVRDMFGRIAPRYDLANHLLSLNIDRSWRRRTVSRVRDVLLKPDARILDLCCGTGDLTIALSERRGMPIFGSDFCHPMLLAAARKSASPFFEADALTLPLPDASLDLITCAFGFRNLVNYDAGLREFRRVLKPGGRVALLEFSTPPNPSFAALYRVYSRIVLPQLGGVLSGVRGAYTYLPESVRKFPNAEELAARMQAVGFQAVTFERWTAGIVALHLGSA